MRKILLFFICILFNFSYALNLKASTASHQPEYSTAGFYQLDNTGRTVYSKKPAWRFFKGKAQGAEQINFDDSNWTLVSLPDGIETVPTEASGCINYQGEVWYRKHFTPEEEWKGKRQFLHFEAIMGKSKVWINGKLVNEHFGGFLPVISDVTDYLEYGKDNIIAVWADNSNDISYPPGKSQETLDFTYFGGIYRDCWMIVHNDVYITDSNYENETAGGGLFVSYSNVSDKSADIRLDAHIRNMSSKSFSGKVEYELYDKNGKMVQSQSKNVSLSKGKARTTTVGMSVENPNLWEPDSPYLYQLHVYIKDKKGETIDGYRRRIGIRSIEFKGKDGFWLNGKPYPSLLSELTDIRTLQLLETLYQTVSTGEMQRNYAMQV